MKQRKSGAGVMPAPILPRNWEGVSIAYGNCCSLYRSQDFGLLVSLEARHVGFTSEAYRITVRGEPRRIHRRDWLTADEALDVLAKLARAAKDGTL